jgi:hypothetical protein
MSRTAPPPRRDHGGTTGNQLPRKSGSLTSMQKRTGSIDSGDGSDTSTRASSLRRLSQGHPSSQRKNGKIAGAVRGQFGNDSIRKHSIQSGYGSVSDSPMSSQNYNAYPVRSHGNLRPPSGKKNPNRSKSKNKKGESSWSIGSLFGGLCCQPGRQNVPSGGGYSSTSPLLTSQKHPQPQAPSPRRSNARM